MPVYPYKRPSSLQTPSPVKERVFAGLSYLSMGMIGLIYYLFSGHNNHSTFFRFHFYQSILAGLFILLFNWALGAFNQVIGGITSMIPGAPQGMIDMFFHFLGYVPIILYLALLYGAVFAFMGKLGDIPGIAKLARMQMRS
ncbi:MAG: hypothetical protein ACRD3W_08900 [Terriglobales bacterium]